MSLTEFRAHLPRAVDEVERGGRVEITRRDRVVAVLLSPTHARNPAVADAIARAEAFGALMAEERKRPYVPIKPCLSQEEADDIIAWIREGRDAR